ADRLTRDSGADSGRRRFSSSTPLLRRLCGTRAVARARALFSKIRSWKEKSQVLRGPRAGETSPASTSERMRRRGSRTSRSTSRTLYWCIADRPSRYFLADFFAVPSDLAVPSADWARFSGLRPAALAAWAGAGAGVAAGF